MNESRRPPDLERPVGRMEERVDVNAELEVLADRLDGFVTNLSRTGAYVRCAEPPPQGARIRFRFPVLADPMVHIEGLADVVRVEDRPGGCALSFVALSDDSTRAIETLLLAAGE